MTSKDTAIWFQNGDEPISFNLQFQNNGDLLTHLIINVELSIPCEITIDDTVDVPYSELIAHSDNSVPSHARLLFPTPTLHNRRVDFTIRAKCQQILNKKVTPTLRLRIESFVPQYTNQFDFNAVSKMKSEFVIEVKKQPMKSIKVPMNTETEVDLNFDVALHIRGLSYDSELVYSAQLLLDDSIDIKVISLDISSPDCTISTVDDLTLDPRVMAQQKFKIAKEQRVEKVHLSVKAKVKFITSKDFQFTLKINPLVRDGADYSLESIFAYEMKHIFMIALGITRTNIAILVLATLGCFLLFTALFLLLHFMILPRFVVGNEEIGYIIDEVAVAEEY
ncbi:hypothetical protein RF11_05155 [Thelohanellus kitauei]|uniref:Uncharacterized protein n=1 Tax=Thelohanellus kitauei TaxID=669202 RepID=A0A0C2J8R2_THEKT|nr:hypothetical protein RF11_05155 [Thelohanellus kitauei]